MVEVLVLDTKSVSSSLTQGNKKVSSIISNIIVSYTVDLGAILNLLKLIII